MLGYRVVVPSKSLKRILDELHSTYLGIVKMKAVARSYVLQWRSMKLGGPGAYKSWRPSSVKIKQ